jgi:hypothetical protein
MEKSNSRIIAVIVQYSNWTFEFDITDFQRVSYSIFSKVYNRTYYVYDKNSIVAPSFP